MYCTSMGKIPGCFFCRHKMLDLFYIKHSISVCVVHRVQMVEETQYQQEKDDIRQRSNER